jgi:hypothetical protein
VILAALACGASWRTASVLAGIDHQTLGRWIERGRNAHPEGRWRQFHDDVMAAESAELRPALLPIPVGPSGREVRTAERLIFGGKSAPPVPDADIPWPTTVKVRFADWEPDDAPN